MSADNAGKQRVSSRISRHVGTYLNTYPDVIYNKWRYSAILLPCSWWYLTTEWHEYSIYGAQADAAGQGVPASVSLDAAAPRRRRSGL